MTFERRQNGGVMVTTRVLVIHQQVGFAVKLKQGLESVGGYEVTPFTTAETALDYLRRRPQDIALLDFTLPGVPGVDLVQRIRSIQPDIAIIASPDLPNVRTAARDLRLHGVVDMPVSIRALIPLIRQSVAQVHDALPDTAAAPSLGGDSDTLILKNPSQRPPATIPEFSTLDSVLVKVGGLDAAVGAETLEVDMSDAGYAEGRSQSIEIVFTGEMSALKDQYDRTKAGHPLEKTASDAVDIFQQLAAEEPPMPTLEESGTVGDLMIGVGDTNLREVVEILKREVILPTPPKREAPVTKGDSQPLRTPPTPAIPAQVILQTALDETVPLEALLSSIELGTTGTAVANERYVREPDFLADAPAQTEDSKPIPARPSFLPESDSRPIPTIQLRPSEPGNLPELDQPGDLSIQTTRMTHPEDVVADPGSLETDMMARPAPPSALPEMPARSVPAVPASPRETKKADELLPPYTFPQAASEDEPAETAPLTPQEEIELETDFAPYTPLPASPVSADVEGVPPDRVTLGTESSDPQVAQLALSLTQASLELAAEALLLAKDGEIVAYAGSMPLEDIEDIRQTVGGGWQAEQTSSHIRFVNLPSSGKDYMLYSRQTEGDYTITMIFAGNMPLRAIRRQSDRLIEALRSVPEPPAPEPPAAPETPTAVAAASTEADTPASVVPMPPLRPKPTAPLLPYTYVWLVRGHDQTLSDTAAQAIIAGLDLQLTHLGWTAGGVRVHEDYVVVQAEVPAERPPHEIIAELKRIAADVAYGADNRIDAAHLWADGYLALAPGRDLSTDEIQRFIHFARMRGG
ncbi:MAG: response regulator [bacterium]|nr:response regulator [bacterium]